MARRVKPGEAISAKSWNEIVDNVNGIGGVASQTVAGTTRTLKARWYNGSNVNIRSGSVVSVTSFKNLTDPISQRRQFVREGFLFYGPGGGSSSSPRAAVTLLADAKKHSFVPCFIEGIVAGFVKRDGESNHKRAALQDIDANGVNFVEDNDGPYEIVCASNVGKLWEGDDDYRFVCMRRIKEAEDEPFQLQLGFFDLPVTITNARDRFSGGGKLWDCPLLEYNKTIPQGTKVVAFRNTEGIDLWHVIEASCNSGSSQSNDETEGD